MVPLTLLSTFLSSLQLMLLESNKRVVVVVVVVVVEQVWYHMVHNH